MRMRDAGRLAFMFLLVSLTGLTAASCGTSNNSTFGPSGLDDASVDAPVALADGGPSLTPPGDGSGSMQNQCVPKTCQGLGYCGMNGDGCGGVLDCGACPATEVCGVGGYSLCGAMPPAGDSGAQDGASTPCTPNTCEELGYDCGWVSNGCSDVMLCGTGPDGGAATLATGADAGVEADAGGCIAPEICGGGGVLNQCGGSTGFGPDGGTLTPCVPKTCTQLGSNCGPQADGCGNLIQCGTCPAGQACGVGAPPGVCGASGLGPDGGPLNLCTPKTCAQLGFTCGPAGDGCGNLIAGGCGTCPAGQACGIGGHPGVCGATGLGPDGGPIDLCTPTTCAQLGFNCGQAGDGCGNALQCGTCTGPDSCGGGGMPGQCGHTCAGDGGLCAYQQACPGGTPTTLTGRVEAGVSRFLNPNVAANPLPFPPDPVPNALVYIPNSAIAPFAPGASCRQCAADVSGSPLVSTYTDYNGTFTLTGVPTPPGTTIPLVVQLGRWRRKFTITTPTACTTSAVVSIPDSTNPESAAGTAGVLNLPRNHTEGDIPFTAVSTGNVDALECVLLKLGVDAAEFTSNIPATGTPRGRINVYAGGPSSKGGSPGATVPNANPETALMAGGGTFMNYDQILFPCWGGPAAKTPGPGNELANLVTYADNGGHFFATHYSYSWLVQNGEFNTVANWDLGPANAVDRDNPGAGPWTLDVSKAPPVVPAPLHAGIFYRWLNDVCALSNTVGMCTAANPYNDAPMPMNLPTVSIANPRFDADSVANGSVDWIDGTDQTAIENGKANPAHNLPLVEHFTFNTPVGATTQCGHAIYSDFHVSNVTAAQNVAFPKECAAGFSPQEKILEYMLFDLASCVQPPTSSCQARTCAQQGLACGPAGDGCGNAIECGPCPAGLTCGGGGTPGQCGAPDAGTCTPLTCAQQSLSCGPAGDGCGNVIPGGCGTCPAGQTCGGGGTPGVCGAPDAGMCVAQTCAEQKISCGPAGDGCGNLIAGGCGPCPPGQTCGGGGTPGVCGAPDGAACAPETCAEQKISCGPAGDGCGNVISGGCGNCPTGQTCGGGGTPGVCGAPKCTPFTCAGLGFNCGPAGDGCGALLQCGVCQSPETCGGGGTPGVCGMTAPR
jgi:hypothetical protein